MEETCKSTKTGIYQQLENVIKTELYDARSKQAYARPYYDKGMSNFLCLNDMA